MRRMELPPSYVGFFGPSSPFSNMHPCTFVIDEVEYSCVEQWMQAEKARVFCDDRTLSLIMDERDPKKIKRLGRMVKPFEKDTWSAVVEDVVRRGLRAKFSANPRLRDALVLTAGKVLVECSPRDRLWGAGCGVATLHKMVEKAAAAESHTLIKLRGRNLLGQLLMGVRAELIA